MFLYSSENGLLTQGLLHCILAALKFILCVSSAAEAAKGC